MKMELFLKLIFIGLLLVNFSNGICLGHTNEISSRWTEVQPDIDGVISAGEWDDAYSLDINLVDTAWHVVEPNIAGTFYIKNDSENLYVALILYDVEYHYRNSVDVIFDNDLNGIVDYGDDGIEIRIFEDKVSYSDRYFNVTGENIRYSQDELNQDGSGYIIHSNPGDGNMGDIVAELVHPLNSGYEDDLSLGQGDVLGFSVYYEWNNVDWDPSNGFSWPLDEEIFYNWDKMNALNIAYEPVPPTIDLDEPDVTEKTVSLNGITLPGTVGSTIEKIIWDWGDGTVEEQWFEAEHTYSDYGPYTVTLTSYQSDSLSTKVELEIVVGSRSEWDHVVFEGLEQNRIGINENIELNGHYNHDDAPFDGVIMWNDTIPKTEVGEYGFRIMGITDNLYGITSFTAEDIKVIYDKVELELSIESKRINVGEEPNIIINGHYLYDNSQFQGQTHINRPTSDDDVGSYEYKVSSITDQQYDVSAFSSNTVSCIWDRLKVTGAGSSEETPTVGDSVTIWYTLEYEFDEDLFDGSCGEISINGEPTVWSSENKRWELVYTSEEAEMIQFEVTDVIDSNYGLSEVSLSAAVPSVEWSESQGIPGFPSVGVLAGVLCFIYLMRMPRKRIF